MPRLLLLLSTTIILTAGDARAPLLLDGSSTVYPISVGMAEAYARQDPQVDLQVQVSGTNAGFRLISTGKIPIAGASRAYLPREFGVAAAAGHELIELPVAFDGMTVAVNPRNTFCTSLTVAELRRIWEPDSRVKTWADVRAGWPKETIKLFGPGKDSGTFDYFTYAINGTAQASRLDYVASEDDNDLVQGIAGDPFALGYFGWAYFRTNQQVLRAVPVDNGKGPVMPTSATILDGTYAPLSRPLFYYVTKASLSRPEVAGLLDFIFAHPAIVEEVGYVPLSARLYHLVRERLKARTVGPINADATPGATLEQCLARGEVGAAVPVAAPAKPAAAAPSPAPAPTAAPARPAPAVVAAPTKAPPARDDARQLRLEALRDASLELARLALDERTAVSDLDRCARDVRRLLDDMGADAGPTSAPTR